MNRDDIIRMAREAGIGWLERAEGITEFLERFAALVSAEWQEKCNTYMELHDAVVKDNDRLYAQMRDPVAQVQVAEDYHAHVVWTEGVNPVVLDQKFLYTAPPQREWQGLTDEEIMKITGVTSADSDWNVVIVHKWIRAIEVKMKEKNNV